MGILTRTVRLTCLTLVALLAVAHVASAAPWNGARAKPHHVQPVVSAAAGFLTERGFAPKVAPRVVSVEAWAFRSAMGARMRDTQAAVLLDSGLMSMDYRTAHQLRALRRAGSGARTTPAPNGARTVLHEVLHLGAPTAPEGLIDAVSLDLTAAFIARYTKRNVRVDRGRLVADGYPGDVWDLWLEQRDRLGVSHLSERARLDREAQLRAYM